MSKKITIDGKEYDIACSAYTRFEYKKMFGTGMMADIKKLSDLSQKQEDYRNELSKNKKLSKDEIEQKVNNMFLDEVDEFIEIIEKITYSLIITATPNFGSFEDFLKGLESIDLASNWVSEVTETAVSSFR